MVAIRSHASRWGSYAALGIATCLILSGGAHGYPDPRKAGGKTTANQTPKPVEKGSAPSPATLLHSDIQRLAAALEEHNRYEKSADAQKDAHTAAQGAKDAAYWAGWMVLAAAFETVVTGVGVVLVGLTLSAARQSAREAKRAADEMARSADSTKDAAWASEVAARNSAQANAYARDRANAELRAYVFVHLIEIERKTVTVMSAFGSAKQKVTTGRVTYRYRNTGKTPARNVHVGARAVIINAGETLDLEAVGEMRPVGPMGPKDSLGDDVPIDDLLHGRARAAH